MIFQDPLSSLHPFYKVGRADRRGRARAPRRLEGAGLGPRGRDALAGRHPGAAQARRRLPARVLGRHAPARDDRDGAGQRPEAADRRRADDRARRDRPGADPRADRDACRASSTPRSWSSPTTSASWPRWPTRSRSCTPAGSSRRPTTDTIFAAPEHPYTWGLLSSIPRLDSPRGEELVPIPGRPPSLINLPGGCSFHPRCPYVREAHKTDRPEARAGAGQPEPPGRLPARRPRCGASCGASCARASSPKRPARTSWRRRPYERRGERDRPRPAPPRARR